MRLNQEPSAKATCTVVFRPEVEADRPGIRAVHLAAFETPLEANLVDALRSEGTSVISLVAEEVGEVIGHIMFSPVTLDRDPGIRLLGLGPMAVRPDRQKSGIGSRLVAEGLLACREQGYDGVVVLGHPDYYPRFGFSAAAGFGLHSEYDVPDEVFMALELVSGSLGGDPRTVRYAPSFSSVQAGDGRRSDGGTSAVQQAIATDAEEGVGTRFALVCVRAAQQNRETFDRLPPVAVRRVVNQGCEP